MKVVERSSWRIGYRAGSFFDGGKEVAYRLGRDLDKPILKGEKKLSEAFNAGNRITVTILLGQLP